MDILRDRFFKDRQADRWMDRQTASQAEWQTHIKTGRQREMDRQMYLYQYLTRIDRWVDG